MTISIGELPTNPFYMRFWLRFQSVASIAASMCVSYGLMTVISIATARLLGPASKGQVAAVSSWSQILIWVGTFGLNTAVGVRVAETFRRPGGPLILRQALGNSVGHSLLIGTGVAVAAMVILSRVLSGLGDGTSRLLLISLAGLPAGILSSILVSLQLSLARTARFTAAQISGPAILGLVLVGRYVMSGRLTAVDVGIAGLVSTVVVLAIVSKGLPWKHMAWNKGMLVEDLRFGGSTAVGAIFGLVNLRLDILILSVIVSSLDLGLYSAANNLMAPILIAPAAAAAHLTPTVARRVGSDGTTRFIFRQSLLFAAVGGLCGVLLAVAAPVLVPLALGEAYRPAVHLIWILTPGFVVRGFASLLVAGAVGQRRPRVGNLAEGLAVVATLVLLPLALPRFGVLGAAWVSTVAYSVSAITAAGSLWRIERKAEQRL